MHRTQAYTRQATDADLLSFYSRQAQDLPWFVSFREKAERALGNSISAISGIKIKYIPSPKGYLGESHKGGDCVCFFFNTSDVRNAFSITISTAFVDTLVHYLFGAASMSSEDMKSPVASPLINFLLNRIGRSIGSSFHEASAAADEISLSHYTVINTSLEPASGVQLPGSSVHVSFEWNEDLFWIALNVASDYCSRLKTIYRTAIEDDGVRLPPEIYRDVSLLCSIATLSRKMSISHVLNLNVGSVISVAEMNCLGAVIYIDQKEFLRGELKIESKSISVQI